MNYFGDENLQDVMTGICKLCNKVEILKESHVVPDFYIRGLEHKLPTGSKGELQPFSIVLSADPESSRETSSVKLPKVARQNWMLMFEISLDVGTWNLEF